MTGKLDPTLLMIIEDDIEIGTGPART